MTRPFCLSLGALLVVSTFIASTLTAQTVSPKTTPTATENFIGYTGDPSLSTPAQGADGYFRGTSASDDDNGQIWAIPVTGGYSTPYVCNGAPDCYSPVNPVVQGIDGYYYGASEGGGANNLGEIYKISSALGNASATITDLYDFPGGTDGFYPTAPIIFDSAGNIYGTTRVGGQYSAGGVWKFTPGTPGTLTVLHQFCQQTNCADGGGSGTIVQGSDGNLYGATGGGANGQGALYKLTTSGTYTLLYSFCPGGTSCTDGASPVNMVEYSDGNFYGVTSGGGADGYGEFFRMTPAGVVTPLYSFTDGNDGGQPVGIMVASDGNFYGAAAEGGIVSCSQTGDSAGCGTIYKLTSAGVITDLVQFADPHSYDDYNPRSAPMQGSDGNLYGVSYGQSFGGDFYQIAITPALAPPVKLTFSLSTVSANSPVTLDWSVSNAFGLTMRQCAAFIQGSPSGAGTWTGTQTGTYSSSTHIYSGSATITPTVDGTYTYALTCGGVESGFASLTVAPAKPASTTTLTVTPSSPSVGQTVTIKATVTGSSGTPTGTVAVDYAGSQLLNLTLSSGTASQSVPTNGLPVGTYALMGNYSGDSTYAASSMTLDVHLVKAPTTTVLIITPTTVTPPGNVTLKATVKRSASGAAGVPGGTVTFLVGTTEVAKADVNTSGVATTTASTNGIAAGKYTLTAHYSGDASDAASTSGAESVTVN